MALSAQNLLEFSLSLMKMKTNTFLFFFCKLLWTSELTFVMKKD